MRIAASRDMRIRFDRGTLVLEPEGTEDPALIPGTRWDGELRAWRMPACGYPELGAELAARGITVSRDEVQLVSLAGPWKLAPPRWYQSVALARWLAAGKRGVIALPTGSGKTVVAVAAIAQLGVATLCLVPTRVLLDQWVRTLGGAWSHPVGRLGDGDHHVAPVTVATYTSATAWASRIGDRFGLVIVDEAHHVGAWCPREVLEMLVAPARLGLTATPPGPGGALASYVGPVVYSLAVDDLAGDALAAYELIPVPIALTGDERSRYCDLRRRFANAYAQAARRTPEMGWNEFVQLASRSAAGREALDAWRGYRAVLAYPAGKRVALRDLLARHADVRTLIFTGDNATTYAIARELLIPPITHEIGRAERERVLQRFRGGEVPALVSSQVLDEGLDVPDADVAIIVGGTASARRHVQRVGRVLRPRSGKRALVYELVVEETTEVDYVKRRRAGFDRPGDGPSNGPTTPPPPSGPVGSVAPWNAVVAAARARHPDQTGGWP
jgi:superfamily II DNA or RNA helicase